MGDSQLSAAKKVKNDEFYTRMTDIEHELVHYKDHFKGKVVLCNCDDPFESNFFKYFALNFNHLGLKRLTAACYSGSPIAGGEWYQPSLFDDDRDESTGRHRKAYKAVVNVFRDTTGDGGLDMDDIRNLLDSEENELTELHGDGTYGAGDFRSRECLELLDEADIVVTNPPFSLFREYVATLVEHGKKFVILGNKNAITYKEIFPLLRDDKVWLGFTSPSDFTIPGEGTTKQVNGLCRWYTNLDIKKRHEDLILYRRYADDPSKYPKYDDYDAIEVSRVKDIPEDHYDVTGVPITFMDRTIPDSSTSSAVRKARAAASQTAYGTLNQELPSRPSAGAGSTSACSSAAAHSPMSDTFGRPAPVPREKEAAAGVPKGSGGGLLCA